MHSDSTHTSQVGINASSGTNHHTTKNIPVLLIPVMVFVAVACLPVFFTGYVISRGNGALFLFLFVAYTLYLILSATQAPILAQYSEIMSLFVIPVAGISLIAMAMRHFFEKE